MRSSILMQRVVAAIMIVALALAILPVTQAYASTGLLPPNASQAAVSTGTWINLLNNVNPGTISYVATPLARVRTNTGTTGASAAASFGVTMSTLPLDGDTMIAVISTRGTSASRVSSILQTGASWSLVSQSTNTSGTTVEIWYAPNVSSAGTAITIQLAESLYAAAVVAEYKGLLLPTPFDVAANASGTGTTASSGTTATTAQEGELWIAGFGLTDNTYTLTSPTSGFSTVNNAASTSGTTSNNARVYFLESIASVTGAAGTSGTVSVSSQWSGAVATFRAVVSTANTFTMPASSNRLVLLGACFEINGAATISSITAKLDSASGAAFTQVIAPSNTARREQCWMGYLKDAEISDGPHSVYLNVAMSASTITGVHINVGTYSGVNQANPIAAAIVNNAAAITIPFGSNLAFPAYSTSVYMASASNIATSVTQASGFNKQLETLVTDQSTTVADVANGATAGTHASSLSVTFTNSALYSAIVATTLNPAVTIVGDGTPPADKYVKGSQSDQAASTFTLATTGAGTVDTVTDLTATIGGTGPANVAAVKLYQDNGTIANEYDAGDSFVASASYVSPAATFTGLNLAVTDTAVRYLLTVDLVVAPTDGETITVALASITSSNIVTDDDNPDATLTVDTAGPTDGTLTVTSGNAQNGLSWTVATDGASGLRATNTYDVRFQIGDIAPTCSTGTSIYLGTGTSHTHSGLVNGTQYSYRVCAYDAVDNVSAGATGSGTPVVYTVTYNGNSNDGGSAPVDDSSPYTSGATVSVLGAGTLTKTGYSFSHWNTASDNGSTSYNPGDTFLIGADTTLYAQWTINQYTISFNSNGGSVIPSITQEFGSSVSVPPDPTRTGYTFAGWFTDDGSFLNAYTFGAMPAENVTLHAKWTVNTYALTINIVGSGTVTKTPDQAAYPYGSTVAFTATPDAGWSFDSWSANVIGGAVTITDNTTVTATFKHNQAALTITAPASLTYGDADADITTLGGSGSGTVSFDAGASTACSILNGKLHILSVSGDCSITATKTGDADYVAVTSAPFTVTIHPKQLTVTADNQAISAGQPDPTFTYTVSGFVAPDTFLAAPTCGVAVPHTTAASYDIECTAGDAGPNYTIAYAKGTLTITAANNPPAFTSTPPLTANAQVNYTYHVATHDPETGPLTLTAPILPSWLTLTDHGDGTATLTGTPAATDLGAHPVTLSVSDAHNPPVEQTFSILVTPLISTLTVVSNGPTDGWILETGLNTNKGGTSDSRAATLRLGDDANRSQYRSILSFNTSNLPDTAVITKVTLKIKQEKIFGGGNPVTTFGGFLADVRLGLFGKSTLEPTDWQSKPNKTVGPFKPTLTAGWYTLDLTAANAYINKLPTNSGQTQIRLRFKVKYTNNSIANTLTLFSGNAGAANRPVLTIQYYVP